MDTEQLKDFLNAHLKSHPEYEEWMQFDEIEVKQGLGIIPRYRSPKSAGVSMTELKAREIYGKVCSDIIKLPS